MGDSEYPAGICSNKAIDLTARINLATVRNFV